MLRLFKAPRFVKPSTLCRYFVTANTDQGTDLIHADVDAEQSSKLTYGSEDYLQHKEEILNKKREKEMEAKFGDFSARLVKRPKKNFMWGFGTQV